MRSDFFFFFIIYLLIYYHDPVFCISNLATYKVLCPKGTTFKAENTIRPLFACEKKSDSLWFIYHKLSDTRYTTLKFSADEKLIHTSVYSVAKAILLKLNFTERAQCGSVSTHSMHFLSFPFSSPSLLVVSLPIKGINPSWFLLTRAICAPFPSGYRG